MTSMIGTAIRAQVGRELLAGLLQCIDVQGSRTCTDRKLGCQPRHLDDPPGDAAVDFSNSRQQMLPIAVSLSRGRAWPPSPG